MLEAQAHHTFIIPSKILEYTIAPDCSHMHAHQAAALEPQGVLSLAQWLSPLSTLAKLLSIHLGQSLLAATTTRYCPSEYVQTVRQQS